MSALAVAVGSVKGSPGATTAALALAAAWPVRGDGVALLVEADGSGGSLRAWCSAGSDEPGTGLVGLAAAVRHGTGAGSGVDGVAHADELVCGVRAVRAPAAGPQAAAAVEVLEQTRFAVLHEDAPGVGVVVVDAGRIAPSGGAWVPGAPDVLVLVARGGVDAMGHVAGRIEQLQASVPVVDLLIVGPSPYEPAEVEAAFGVGRVHVWPWDPAGVRGLVEGRRGWRRARLPRAARALAEDVCWRADTGQLIDRRASFDSVPPQGIVGPGEGGFARSRGDGAGGGW